MITVKDLVKEYRVRKNYGGFKGLFSRDYNTIRAVDGLSFDVSGGELVGFIGPNGAGKSTTIKMLASILSPTSGYLEINGLQPSKNRKNYVKQIGAMFGQKTQLWWDLPLKDSYVILKAMYKIDDHTYNENMRLFTEVLELDKFIDQPVRQLSLGQRVRGDLAAALLHNPRVVFLDEPMLGIDLVAKKNIREFLKTICAQKNITILLTSHEIADIETLCGRVIVINHGKKTWDGDLNVLRTAHGTKRRLEIEFDREYPDFTVAGTELTESKGVTKVFSFGMDISPSCLIGQISAAHEIVNLHITEPRIEDVIAGIYRDKEGRM